MDISLPDFYMVSTEAPELSGPRKCWRIKRMNDSATGRDDLLLIKVDPPINSLHIQTDKAIIAAKFVGTSVFPISEWPLFVYVDAACVDDIESRDAVQPGDIRQVDWAALLPTEDEAQAFMISPSK